MDQRVRAAIDFMKTNLQRKLTSKEIAQSVHLSSSRLHHLFKNETGKSLVGYRRDLQLERTKQLLETTFLSIKEVAANVGISGISHFVRDFKKAYGMRPSEYAECYRDAHTKPVTAKRANK